jgi:hypothetical protein
MNKPGVLGTGGAQPAARIPPRSPRTAEPPTTGAGIHSQARWGSEVRTDLDMFLLDRVLKLLGNILPQSVRIHGVVAYCLQTWVQCCSWLRPDTSRECYEMERSGRGKKKRQKNHRREP